MTPGFLLANASRLITRRELHFEFDRIPLTARRISKTKMFNLFRIAINRLLPVSRTLGRPYMAHVSPSGLCDLSCFNCPKDNPDLIGKGFLPFETFKKFIDECGETLLYLILWSWGEPLLNPDFHRMTSYAENRNILTVTSTNLNRFGQEQAERLVSSGLDALIIALDGATAATYAKLRPGGDFHRVLENTRILVEEKKRARALKPFLNLRMVVSRENENEVECFMALARSLKVDMVSLKSYSTRQSGKADPECDRKFAPRNRCFRWYGYDAGYHVDDRPGRFRCRFPWTKPMLFPDGSITACEFDFLGNHIFGNINSADFDSIWFGPKAESFRRSFSRNRDAIAYCRNCVYDYRQFSGCVFGRDFLIHDVES